MKPIDVISSAWFDSDAENNDKDSKLKVGDQVIIKK